MSTRESSSFMEKFFEIKKEMRGRPRDEKKGWSPFKRQPLTWAQIAVRGRRSAVQDQAASLALTCSTMPAKAALSCTAISASILRSISMPALRDAVAANWL